MSEPSEWVKRFGDMIALLKGADPNNPESRQFCGDKMGAMSYAIYLDDLEARWAAADVAADTSSVNPDSGSPSAAD